MGYNKDGSKNKKRILFITPFVKMERISGGSIVTNERLSSFMTYHNVTVFAMTVDNEAMKYFKDVSWCIFGSLKPRNIAGILKSYIKKLPLSVWRNTSSESLEKISELNTINWDLVYVDHWLMMEIAVNIKNKVSILNLHNAEPEVFFRAAKKSSFLKKIIMFIEGYRCASYLQKKILTFEGLHLLSEDDAEMLKRRGIKHLNTRVFLPTVKVPDIIPAEFENREFEILFVGTLSWHANEEGLIWYIEEVLQSLDSTLIHNIIGGGASPALSVKMSDFSNINAPGYIDNIEPFYQSSKCLIAPLLSGSGVKIKILNALARGLPVVTTPLGVEGFPDGYQDFILVADSPKEFSNAIKKITIDKWFWLQASQKSIEYYNRNFSGKAWEKWAKELIL